MNANSNPSPTNYRLRWAYGVMTVPSRRDTHLIDSLASLNNGGFDTPHLFVDGCRDASYYDNIHPTQNITLRYPSVGVAGNWVLSMYELFYRNRDCERFAIFQDDLLCSRNLRAYLDKVPYPKDGYWNLYTFPSNHEIATKGNLPDGFHLSHQNGRGALGLVFDRECLMVLLGSKHLAERPIDVARGHKAIDGGVVESMRKAGRKEYVHNPSLLQHTGMTSTMDKRDSPHKPGRPMKLFEWSDSTLADSFRGEMYDLLRILENK